MIRAKQSVKKGLWYIGGKKKKKRKQTVKGIHLGVIALVAGPILSEVAKPISKKYLEEESIVEKLEDGKTNSNFKKKSKSKSSKSAKGRSFTSKWERISRKQLPINIRVNRHPTIGPRKNNRMIYLNLAAPGFRKIKKKKKAKHN